MVSNFVTYCSTKFYVSAFTEGLAEELKAKGKLMKVKILAPSVTETEFASHALDVENYDIRENFSNVRSASEVAEFMIELYDSEEMVGIVDGKTNHFELKGAIFPHISKI